MKQNERVNGIFDEWDVPDKYSSISESYAKGQVKEEVRIITEDTHSDALFTNEIKNHTCLELTLANDRGQDVVRIPQEEIPTLSELNAMKDSAIEYTSRTWSSILEGTSVEHTIAFLDGELKGQSYKGERFA